MFCMVKDGVVFESSVSLHLVCDMGAVLDYEKRTLSIGGKIDSITYSQNETIEWFERQATKRAIELFKRQGYQFYKVYR